MKLDVSSLVFCLQICTRLERELAAKASELESLRGATTIAEEARSTAARQVRALLSIRMEFCRGEDM
jgi:hypothetical protein